MTLIIMFAPAIGPSLSGVILGFFSWRALFFIFAIVLAVGLFYTAKYLVSPYELTRPKVDIASCVLSCLGFGGIVLGFGLSSLLGWGSAGVVCSLVVGVIALAFYIRRQLSSETPVLNLRAFAIPQFRVSAVLVMVNFGITLAAMYLLPQFAQNGLGLSVTLRLRRFLHRRGAHAVYLDRYTRLLRDRRAHPAHDRRAARHVPLPDERPERAAR